MRSVFRRERRELEWFEALYLAEYDRVTAFFARRVEDPHQVADLTAEVFLAALRAAHTFDPARGNEIGWLYGIARNALRSEYRRSSRFDRALARVRGQAAPAEDDVAELIDRIDAETAARALMSRLAELPDGQREVLELVAIDGLSIAEAAHALGIDDGNARVRLHRARQKLRDIPGIAVASGREQVKGN